jgi:hypothetical protein
VFLGPGQQATDLRLIAHETAHVIQQQGSPALQLYTATAGDRMESEARSAAAAVVGGTSFAVRGRTTSLVIQRDDGGTPGAASVSSGLGRSDGGVERERSDAGAGGSGESLPGGVPPTPAELEASRLRSIQPSALEDQDIGPAFELATQEGDWQRAAAIVTQLRERVVDLGFGVGLPAVLPRGQGGSALVTPAVALDMIENMIRGRPPFAPELGVGGASWFVTEGTPYTGVGSGNVVPVQAELVNASGGRVYQQSDLDAIFAEEEARARPEVEAQVRERFRIRTGKDAPARLSNALAEKVAYQLRRLAERRMWERIGREVAASPRKVGEVVLPAGGRFSALAGRFKIIADATRIRIRGGVRPLIEALRPHATPVPALEAEAAALARSMAIAGTVRAVFRVGGRILIFAAVAYDIYRIIIAEDKLEAVITTVAGWAGAAAGAAAFSALWTPADTAGPWAWAAHGVGALVAGGIGYWVGAEATRYVYRLVVQTQGEVRAE